MIMSAEPFLSGRHEALSASEAKDLLLLLLASEEHGPASGLPERPVGGQIYALRTALPIQKLMRRFYVKGFQARSSKEFPLAAANNNEALIRIR